MESTARRWIKWISLFPGCDYQTNRGSRAFVCVLLLALAALFFIRNIKGAMPAIPFDLLYQYHPWQADTPKAGFSIHNPELSDQVLQFYPWRQLAIEELKHGRLPLWNPFSFCGSPLFANGQSAILFPLNLLALLFGQITASIVLGCLQLFIAALFTWAFLRRLGLCNSASVFGAVVFAFSRNVVVWLGFPAGNAAILLPALFWACEWLIESPGLIPAFIGAALIAVQFLAGQPQTSIVCFFGVSLYLFFRMCARSHSWNSRLRALSFYAGSWLLGVFLAAVQILPLLEYMKESAAFLFRFHFNLKAYPWYELVSFVVPNFFGTAYDGNYWGFANLVGAACYFGVVPLILALMSLFRGWGRTKVGAFWLLALISLGIIYRVPGLDAILHLPLFNSIDTNKFLVLIVFSLAVCSSLELNCIIQKEETRIFWRGLAAAVAIFLFGFFVRIRFNEFVSTLKLQAYERRNLLVLVSLVIACLVVFYFYHRGRLSAAGFCLILLALSYSDLYWSGFKYNAAVPRDWQPKTPSVISSLPQDSAQYRLLGMRDILPPNTSALYSLADVRGYDAMTPKRYFEFLSRIQPGYADFLATLDLGESHEKQASVNQSTLFRREVQRMLGAPNRGLRDLLQRSFYWNTNLDSLVNSNTLGLFSVKYVIASPGITDLPGHGLRLISKGGATVFENADALPRCFLRHDFEIVDEKIALQIATQPNFDFKKRLLLSGITDPGTLRRSFDFRKVNPLFQEHAKILHQTLSSVEIAAGCARPKILVLNDLFSAGWEAYVDGQQAEIYEANYIFRAVALFHPGEHRILFKYRPRGLRFGALITLGTVLFSCAVLFFHAVGNRRAQ